MPTSHIRLKRHTAHTIDVSISPLDILLRIQRSNHPFSKHHHYFWFVPLLHSFSNAFYFLQQMALGHKLSTTIHLWYTTTNSWLWRGSFLEQLWPLSLSTKSFDEEEPQWHTMVHRPKISSTMMITHWSQLWTPHPNLSTHHPCQNIPMRLT